MGTSSQRTLAFQHFQKALEEEIRTFHLFTTSLEYTRRWWESVNMENRPVRISEYPGDNRNPFTSIDISPDQYISGMDIAKQNLLENSIVNIITTFEVYLLDTVRRMIFLFPSILSESEVSISAYELAEAISRGDIKEWFADHISSKYMRNNTHLKMLKKIESITKCDLSAESKIIAEWEMWTVVRNAIVHNGRGTTSELSTKWSDRFSSIGNSLNIVEKEFARVHYISLELARKIDGRVIAQIKEKDAELFIRELFVRYGLEDPKILARIVNRTLGNKMKRPDIEKQLGFQRRSNQAIEGWTFTPYNFTFVKGEIEYNNY